MESYIEVIHKFWEDHPGTHYFLCVERHNKKCAQVVSIPSATLFPSDIPQCHNSRMEFLTADEVEIDRVLNKPSKGGRGKRPVINGKPIIDAIYNNELNKFENETILNITRWTQFQTRYWLNNQTGTTINRGRDLTIKFSKLLVNLKTTIKSCVLILTDYKRIRRQQSSLGRKGIEQQKLL
jgi:hypothetical protein